jgi:hypothetical protein
LAEGRPMEMIGNSGLCCLDASLCNIIWIRFHNKKKFKAKIQAGYWSNNYNITINTTRAAKFNLILSKKNFKRHETGFF